MKRLKKLAVSGLGLKYLFCEDWFIYAYDKNNKLYFANTELWPEWSNFLDNQQEKDAVEKYILPIAKENWNEISWQDAGYTINEEELKNKQFEV